MSDTSHVAFFGDAEHTFRLTPPMIVELERLTGSPIGVIVQRFADLAFSHTEMIETIRCGLIGGGTTPQRAKELVETYALGRPIVEVRTIAWGVIRAAWFGTPEPKPITPSADIHLDMDAIIARDAAQ